MRRNGPSLGACSGPRGRDPLRGLWGLLQRPALSGAILPNCAPAAAPATPLWAMYRELGGVAGALPC